MYDCEPMLSTDLLIFGVSPPISADWLSITITDLPQIDQVKSNETSKSMVKSSLTYPCCVHSSIW